MGTTINAVNLGIGIDYSKLQEGGINVRAEVAKIGQIMRAAKTDADKYREEVELLNRAHEAAAITNEGYQKALDAIDKKYKIILPEVQRQIDKEKELAAARELDAQKLQKQADYLNKLEQMVRAGKTEEQKYREELELLNRAHERGVISNKQYEQALAGIDRKYKIVMPEVQRQIDKEKELANARAIEAQRIKEEAAALQAATAAANAEAAALQRTIAAHGALKAESRVDIANRMRGGLSQTPASGGMGSLLAKGVALVGGFVAARQSYQQFTEALNQAKAFETASQNIEVYVGSLEKAKELQNSLLQLDQNSVLGLPSFQRASSTLLQFGADAKKLPAILGAIDASTGGNAERFEMMSLAMGQVLANGKLMGQDLNQLIQHGFNPLKDISDATGQSMAELRKQMEAGAISSDLVVKALVARTEAGGKLDEMLQKRKETIAGKESLLSSQIAKAYRGAGEILAPAYKQFLGELIQAGNVIENDINKLRGVTTATQEATDATDKMTSSVKQLYEEQKRLAEQQAMEKAHYESISKQIEDAAAKIKALHDQMFDAGLTEEQKLAEMLNPTNAQLDGKLLEQQQASVLLLKQITHERERQKQIEAIDKIEERQAAMEKETEQLNFQADKAAQLKKELERIAELRNAGLSAEAEAKMKRELVAKFGPQMDTSGSIAPALKAGTVEAWKQIQSKNERDINAKIQQDLLKNIDKKLEQANKINEKAPRLIRMG